MRNQSGKGRYMIAMTMMVVAIVLLFAGILISGTVSISSGDVLAALRGGAVEESVGLIVWQVRLPMALTSLIAGIGLAVSGLLMQTTFNNPLAGPSILGVSTGASLGVAVVMLLMGGWLGAGIGYYAGILIGAAAGAALVMGLLIGFSMVVRNGLMLLIAGVLTGYLASSGISLLNFFATQQGVHSYVIWGMGNFGGLTLDRVWVFGGVTLALILGSLLMVKPLNALLLGRRYAESMGVRIVAVRNWLMFLSGGLAAAVAAFCGPIGFLGLVMPHVARMLTGSADHGRLLPATMLAGGAGAMFCAWLSVIAGGGQIIPVNAITPLISVPIIIYVLIKGQKGGGHE